MLLFLDLETTGLTPGVDAVLEVAALAVTDDLETVVDEYNSIVAWDGTLARGIDPYVVAMHTRNGLWATCLADATIGARPLELIDTSLREFIRSTGCGGGERAGAQLAGNSIHFDRAFMRASLPLALAELHYRQLDVSSLNELARRVFPDVHAGRPGAGGPPAHRALADAQQSLETARYYAKALRPIVVPARRVMIGDRVRAIGCLMDGSSSEHVGTISEIDNRSCKWPYLIRYDDPDKEAWAEDVELDCAGGSAS